MRSSIQQVKFSRSTQTGGYCHGRRAVKEYAEGIIHLVQPEEQCRKPRG